MGASWFSIRHRVIWALNTVIQSVCPFVSLLGEAGGFNLYAYYGNDPLNKWDYLGMAPVDATVERTKYIDQLIDLMDRVARHEVDADELSAIPQKDLDFAITMVGIRNDYRAKQIRFARENSWWIEPSADVTTAVLPLGPSAREKEPTPATPTGSGPFHFAQGVFQKFMIDSIRVMSILNSPRGRKDLPDSATILEEDYWKRFTSSERFAIGGDDVGRQSIRAQGCLNSCGSR